MIHHLMRHFIALKQRVLFRSITPKMRQRAARRQGDYDIIVRGNYSKPDKQYTTANQLSFVKPLVSVITRTMKGREFFLKEALMSVLKQDYPAVELLVVMDSIDKGQCLARDIVKKICPAFEQRGFSLRFIAPGRIGRCVAGNIGLAEANGELCLFLDDDDLLLPCHITILAAALTDAPPAIAAYARSLEVQTDVYRQNNQVVGYQERRYNKYTIPKISRTNATKIGFKNRTNADSFRDIICLRNATPIQAVLFRRCAFTKLGGFDVQLDALEDWNLWFRYSMIGDFISLPQITSIFRTPASHAERVRRQKTMDKFNTTALARNKLAKKKWEKKQKEDTHSRKYSAHERIHL